MKNLFAARFNGTRAFIGNLEIEPAGPLPQGHGHIAIRPEDIVLSKDRIASSMRNQLPGRVTGIFDLGFYYGVHVLADDVTFKSLLTKRSLFEMGIREGVEIFLSLKATALHTL